MRRQFWFILSRLLPVKLFMLNVRNAQYSLQKIGPVKWMAPERKNMLSFFFETTSLLIHEQKCVAKNANLANQPMCLGYVDKHVLFIS